MTGLGDPLGIVQEISIWQYKQIVDLEPVIYPGEYEGQSSRGFCHSIGSPNFG